MTAPTAPSSDSRRHRFSQFQQLDHELRDQAVVYLRVMLAQIDKAAIADTIRHDPEHWPYSLSAFVLTRIKNILRHGMFDERAFRIPNLNDYYLGILGLAVMGDGYFDDLKATS